MTWATDAQNAIAKVVASLPEDADYHRVQQALRAHSHRFTGGTSWGKKIWPRECKRYLAMRFGQTVKVASGVERIKRDDIVFPFRGQ